MGEGAKRSTQRVEELLEHCHMLSALEKEEDLFLYLAVSKVAVSVVLLREEEGKQKLVFYTSKMLWILKQGTTLWRKWCWL